MSADPQPLLADTLAALRAALAENFTGLYLFGSLVWGDFDPDTSDIDLLCAVERRLSEAEFAALDAAHARLSAAHPFWEDRLEIGYLERAALRSFQPEVFEIAAISPGEPFHRKPAGRDWLVNLYGVQASGASLAGSPPGELIAPISRADFLAQVKALAGEWREYIVHTRSSRPYQGFAVLTLCRALYAVRFGEQVSKKRAAEWAQQAYPHWADAIQQAWLWRQNWREPVADPTATYPAVEALVRAMADECCA